MKTILTIIFLIAAQYGEAQQYSTPVIKTYIGSWKDTIKTKKVTADFGVILQIDSLSGDIFATVDTNIWQRKSSGGGLSFSSTVPTNPIFRELTDTTPVIIVYIDTGKWKVRGDAGTKTFVEENVKWMSGYSVRKWDEGNNIVNNTNRYRPIGWVHIKYLDILKRPLGENLVVWLSK